MYSVVIMIPRDGRGPATSAHLRNYVAYINGVLFGWFASIAAAEKACKDYME